MKPHLKLQQELFLSFLLDRLVIPIGPGAAPGIRKGDLEKVLDANTWGSAIGGDNDVVVSSGGGNGRRGDRGGNGGGGGGKDGRDGGYETKELMLEILAGVARDRWSMVELWVNYDCNIEGEDLFERLVRFMSRVSFSFSSPHFVLMRVRKKLIGFFWMNRVFSQLILGGITYKIILNCFVWIRFWRSSIISFRG